MTTPQYDPPPDDQGIPVTIPPSAKKQRAPDDSELAARWIMYNRQSAFGLGEFRKYKDGIWPPVDRDMIRKEIKAILEKARPEGIRPSNGLLSSVCELTRVEISVPSEKWDAHPDYLPCKNGVLDIPTKQLMPHIPDIYATSQLPFDYDPNATCPGFMRALNQIADAADFLQEFAGYALTPDIKHETAIWLYGPIGSGKSTIIEGFEAMLGARCGKLGLADIERSKFALCNIPGKTLVTSTEQPDIFIQASHVINSLISGETLTVERKYYDAVDIKPHAKIMWAMNELPRISNVNNGIMRRVKVIKFPVIPECDRDPDLKELIKTEGAGILNWALIGLKRLRKRGKFLIPQSVMDATKDFQEHNDIPAMFIEEIGAKINFLDPQCRTGSQYLYNQYRDWCINNGHKSMSSTRMADEWRRLGFTRVDINGHRYWQGIEISAWTSASNVP